MYVLQENQIYMSPKVCKHKEPFRTMTKIKECKYTHTYTGNRTCTAAIGTNQVCIKKGKKILSPTLLRNMPQNFFENI